MRLPRGTLSLQKALEEFDVWITPSLGEITDTKRFKEEVELVSSAFDAIGNATNNFANSESCNPSTITETILSILETKPLKEREKILLSLGSTLFVVTGKSDNNFKCQFPLYLHNQAGWVRIPSLMRKSETSWNAEPGLPRILKSKTLLSLIARMTDREMAARLLKEFISFLLKDERAINQLWSIGYSYFALKHFDKSQDLLAPIVIFKIRGSVIASGGHEPEAMLRKKMIEWGLQAGIDFNLNDVIVSSESSGFDKKRRAFDFVLPYKTPGWNSSWGNRVFIQCQFYAGDSGSVSHKNIDQTKSSRDHLSSFLVKPLFVEYVDGAGYFSSLNGDLKKLLAYPDTASFFQIRSASIRLRRELQRLGYLTPLELEHAVALTDGTKGEIYVCLRKQGYNLSEVKRAIDDAIKRGFLHEMQNATYAITDARRELVRRYLLLDLVASHGASLNKDTLAGKALIPGYGPFFGMSLDELAGVATANSISFRDEWNQSQTFLRDIRWLCEEGLMLAR